MHASELASVPIGELLGPSDVPAPLHDPPRVASGEVDWNALHALVVAIESLVAAGLAAQARPLASELRLRIDAARGPSAAVVELGAERARR